MAQPDPRSPKGNRPPNNNNGNGGGPAEPGFNWKGLVLVSIAIGLFFLAWVLKGGPMDNFIPYPQFVKLLEDDQIVKEKGIDLLQKGIAKGGLKHPDEAKLMLGIAYFQAGQMPKAIETFNSVTGGNGAADVAHLWTIRAKQG